MNHYKVFLEKELRENLRTHKLLVLLCVFLFFAFSSPLMVRYMAEFLGLILTGDDALLLAHFATTTWRDSYAGFYNDMTFTGVIVIVFMFMGLVLREKKTGTADLVFCKGVCPTPFILAKFTVSVLIAWVCLLVAVLVVHVNTLVLFEENGQILHVLASAGAYGVFLLLAISWIILASTLAKGTAGSAVMGFLGILGMMTVSAIPRLGQYIPGGLMMRNAELAVGHFYPELVGQLIVAVCLTSLCLMFTIYILKKQEL
jgi:ABC-2 type transport system permease protein